ncbi:MAG: hypothetical protein KAH18_00195 [Psychromonas sp.]|nr:hypothetical protein [Psychromonas sp.]
MPNGILTHNTFIDVINRIDQNSFALCFTTWIKQLVKQF